MRDQATPDLVLILPDGITETGALRTLAEAIQKFRASVLGEAARLDQVAATAGEPVRRMLVGSQADAYRDTICRLDEAISGHEKKSPSGRRASTRPSHSTRRRT
jgi:hypothetical protein